MNEHDRKFSLLTTTSLEVTYDEDGECKLDTLMGPHARRIYVGTGGDVVAQKLHDAGLVTYKNVPDGTYLDGAWILIDSTSSATDMVAEQ